MANQVIRVGMVGLGNWARYGHLPALTHLPNYAVTAVWSRRADHAAAVAKEFVVAAVEAEYRSLVTRPDVDLVAVLVPAPQHAEVVRAAIAARKDVYCEWPLATTTTDGEDLSGRVTRAGVRHVVGLQRRFGPECPLHPRAHRGRVRRHRTLSPHARQHGVFHRAPRTGARMDGRPG